MKNKKIVAGAVAIVLLGVGFGGGYAFAKSQAPARGQFGSFNVNGQMVQFSGRAGAGGTVAFRGGANGGFSAGEIISKDTNGITIKMQDGSTKIILVGSSAQIMKQTTGSLSDLSVGQNVMITGSTNSDGSITAQTVSLRPMGFSTTTSAR